MDITIISSRVKDLRTSLGLTQADFASSISTAQAALSGYERGDRIPSTETLLTIAEKYNVSVDWLCGISEKKTVSDVPETYSDLIKLLMSLKDTNNICIEWNLKQFTGPTLATSLYKKLICTFDDKYITDFYDEWQDILSVCKKSPSGTKLYQIWLKDVFERYNFKLECAFQDPLNKELLSNN